jgi:hypothetical protein
LLPCIHPFWVFPDPNVLLIRTHPNPFPSIRHMNYYYYILLLYYYTNYYISII